MYHYSVTGDQFQSAEALDVWKVLYPRDFRPANALAVIYNRLGLYDRAVKEAQEALARYPDHAFALSNLAYAYRGLGRFEESKKVANRAVSLRIATVPTRRLLYHLAAIEGDTATAQALIASAKGTSREFDFLGAQAAGARVRGPHEGGACAVSAGDRAGRTSGSRRGGVWISGAARVDRSLVWIHARGHRCPGAHSGARRRSAGARESARYRGSGRSRRWP